MSDGAALLAKRRDRAIAIILAVKEKDIDRHLPPGERSKLRKVILDQLNDFYDVAADLLDQGDYVDNELYAETLAKINSDVAAIRDLLEAS